MGKNRNKTKLILLAIVIVAVALFALYIHGQNFSGVNASGQNITINYANVKIYDPTYIAYELGYFKEENITINFVGDVVSGPQSIVAVSSGSADAGIAAIPALINAKAAGANVIGVLDAQTAFNDSPLAEWFVLNSSNLTNASQLKGKRIGLNSLGASFYYSTLVYLNKHRLSANDVEFSVLPLQNIEQTLRSNQIDVGGLIDPYTTHAQSVGGVRVLFNQYNATGQNQFTLIFFSTKFAAEYPNVVKAFSKAYVEAIQYSMSNPSQAEQIISNWTGINQSYINPHRFTQYAQVNNTDINYWIGTMENFSGSRININAEEIGTNQYNPYIYPNYT